MDEKIKVYLDKDESMNYDDYKFADGPHEGKVAFSMKTTLMEGLTFENRDDYCGVCVRGDRTKQVVFDGFEIVKAKPKNEVVIKASCGQKMTLELNNIDKNRDIDEVTIRGVRYTPSK